MAETQEQKRIVFMGTPALAASVLKKLLAWPKGHVVAVYTQPDRPGRRGMKFLPSPVKQAALCAGLPVCQPQNFRDAAEIERLRSFAPDFIAVAAYGVILPDSVLATPAIDILNVHASLLPRYRGAAPIQRAIMENWDEGAETGVSIMRIVHELDAGPVFASASLPILDHTAASLHEALGVLGGDLLVSAMDDILCNGALPIPQDDSSATYAQKLVKADGDIRWNRPARAVHAHIRGVTPWPGAHGVFLFSALAEPVVLQFAPGTIEGPCNGYTAGTVRMDKLGLSVACEDNWYRLTSVKPSGRGMMPSSAWANGHLKGTSGVCGRAEAPDALR